MYLKSFAYNIKNFRAMYEECTTMLMWLDLHNRKFIFVIPYMDKTVVRLPVYGREIFDSLSQDCLGQESELNDYIQCKFEAYIVEKNLK